MRHPPRWLDHTLSLIGLLLTLATLVGLGIYGAAVTMPVMP